MSNFYDKLRAVQLGFNAPKNRYNAFGDFYYRSAEDMEAALKPLLNEHGLTMIISDEVVMVGERYYVKAFVYVTDGEDSQTTNGFAREIENKTKSDPAQITGMASSYARKYAISGMFLVDDQRDADAEEKKPSEKSPVDQAKSRMWVAIQKCAEKEGKDPKAVLTAVYGASDYEESVEYIDQKTLEFEMKLKEFESA